MYSMRYTCNDLARGEASVLMLVSAVSLPAVALLTREISVDAGLWGGGALLLAAALSSARPRSTLPRILALALAVMLTSLALVSA
jgi:hypothetical protein